MRRFSALVALLVVVGSCSSADGAETTTQAARGASATAASVTSTTSVPSSTTAAPGADTRAGSMTGFPADVATDAGTVKVAAPPQRIAALSAVFVEMLYAIGAGDRLIAGDLFSNHPAQASSLEKLDSFNLNLEAVIALDPDLVVLSFDPGDVVAGLEAVGIPTLLFETATSLEAAYAQIAALGTATGQEAGSAAVIAAMEAGIAEVVARVDGAATGVSYYHESDPFTFYTPNSSSFIGQLYALLGMENIADAAPDEFGGGFPQLSPEYIVAADPAVIFLASFGEDAETLAAREGWDSLTAVQTGNVFLLDPDVASRWGPRVVELMQAIGESVSGLVE